MPSFSETTFSSSKEKLTKFLVSPHFILTVRSWINADNLFLAFTMFSPAPCTDVSSSFRSVGTSPMCALFSNPSTKLLPWLQRNWYISLWILKTWISIQPWKSHFTSNVEKNSVFSTSFFAKSTKMWWFRARPLMKFTVLTIGEKISFNIVGKVFVTNAWQCNVQCV